MTKLERQQQIIRLLEQNDDQETLGTRVLAERFGVSEMTIRRDLDELAESGRLRRQHGGAAPIRRAQEPPRREIGVVLELKIAKYSDPFFNSVLEGADRQLQALGYRIAYINTGAEVITAAQAHDLLRAVSVSGIIVVGPPLGAESIEYLKANVRVLVGTLESLGSDHDAVTFDGYNGMRRMVDHVVGRGRRRLGFITGRYDMRQQGFTDAVRAHGLPNEADLCVTLTFGLEGWTPEMGHAGAERLMALPAPPDAIVCASDRLAIGAIQWMHQHGLRVPDDIAVTGFDDIAEAAFTVPPLTTVHVHKHLIGELAAERVVRRIENEDEVPLFIQTPTRLVIRQSCG